MRDHQQASSTFIVSPEDAGARLDVYLASRVPSQSRARISRLIDAGDTLVNGRLAKPSHRLREGDEIDFDVSCDPSSAAFVPENIPLEILYEDGDLAVINKPAGMVVHPGAGVAGGTLANALAYHFSSVSRSGGEIRPGIVHRLDRDTSGLMVAAKTDFAHHVLSDQFRAREVFKQYVALVHGRVEADAGKIEEAIARDPRHRTRMAVVRGGRPALSLFNVTKRYERFTLLEVEIRTGRTHQIRVHLKWMGHPVVGDDVYGGGRDKTVADPIIRAAISRLGRLFLHAQRLAFKHPRTGEQMRFSAPMPRALGGFLDLLAPVAR